MVRTLLEVVTNRGGVERKFNHANPYSVVAKPCGTLQIECHHLDDRGKVSGYHGAAYPMHSVRELNFREVNES